MTARLTYAFHNLARLMRPQKGAMRNIAMAILRRMVRAVVLLSVFGCSGIYFSLSPPSYVPSVSRPTGSFLTEQIYIVEPDSLRASTYDQVVGLFHKRAFVGTPAPVITRSNTELWVIDAFPAALQQTGYKTVPIDNEQMLSAQGQPVQYILKLDAIQVKLMKISDEVVSFQVGARVQLLKDRHELFKRQYSGSYQAEPGTIIFREFWSQSFDKALSQLLAQAIPDLSSFLAHQG